MVFSLVVDGLVYCVLRCYGWLVVVVVLFWFCLMLFGVGLLYWWLWSVGYDVLIMIGCWVCIGFIYNVVLGCLVIDWVSWLGCWVWWVCCGVWLGLGWWVVLGVVWIVFLLLGCCFLMVVDGCGLLCLLFYVLDWYGGWWF